MIEHDPQQVAAVPELAGPLADFLLEQLGAPVKLVDHLVMGRAPLGLPALVQGVVGANQRKQLGRQVALVDSAGRLRVPTR